MRLEFAGAVSNRPQRPPIDHLLMWSGKTTRYTQSAFGSFTNWTRNLSVAGADRSPATSDFPGKLWRPHCLPLKLPATSLSIPGAPTLSKHLRAKTQARFIESLAYYSMATATSVVSSLQLHKALISLIELTPLASLYRRSGLSANLGTLSSRKGKHCS